MKIFTFIMQSNIYINNPIINDAINNLPISIEISNSLKLYFFLKSFINNVTAIIEDIVVAKDKPPIPISGVSMKFNIIHSITDINPLIIGVLVS